jgi:hypothetical protein
MNDYMQGDGAGQDNVLDIIKDILWPHPFRGSDKPMDISIQGEYPTSTILGRTVRTIPYGVFIKLLENMLLQHGLQERLEELLELSERDLKLKSNVAIKMRIESITKELSEGATPWAGQ